MQRILNALFFLLLCSFCAIAGCSRKENTPSAAPAVQPASTVGPLREGAELFNQYCAACHPNGGNVSDPERTLYGQVLKSRHISSPEDIVRIMRNPMSRMIRFDVSTLSDRDALTIAEYVLKTFK